MSNRVHDPAVLSDYLDGGLSVADQEAVERHLEECGECVRLLGELREVVVAARALPSVPPGRDLWPDIRARLGSPDRVAPASPAARVLPIGPRRRVTLTVPQLMAASLAVAAVSAALVWAALGSVQTAPSAVMAAAEAAEGAPWLVSSAYEPGMSALEAEYNARRDELDPETIMVIERNLAIIDEAIREAGEALAADPSSGFLNTRLADALRRRMSILREVTSI
jgi:anti-sigma factor RsiW